MRASRRNKEGLALENSRLLAVIAAASLAFVALNACAPSGGDHSNEVGDVAFALTGPGGVVINSVAYSITGPMGYSRSGSMDVSHSSQISGIFADIPVGAGFSVALTADSADGREMCAGSAAFSVAAHQTTAVKVAIDCHEAPTTGMVLVNGVLNICPQIDGVAAMPSEVFVGSSISLSVQAHDADNAPSPLSYLWVANTGALSSSTIVDPMFTCTTVGPATITVTVTDGDNSVGCPDTQSVTVMCTARTAVVTFDASSTNVRFAVNDGGFWVETAQIPPNSSSPGLNATSSIAASAFQLTASGASYSDAGIVLYFDGSLKLGDLLSVNISSDGSPLSMNLWLDSGGDGKFFAFDSNGLYSGLNGDSYGGHNGETHDLTSPFYMLGGNGVGNTYTLAQLQSGSATGIDANTRVALWIGITNGGGTSLTAHITSVTVTSATGGPAVPVGT
jgi:hypothetical protein